MGTVICRCVPQLLGKLFSVLILVLLINLLCVSAIKQIYNCTFEVLSDCNLFQDTLNDVTGGWKYSIDKTPPHVIFPDYDHTHGDQKGHYIHLFSENSTSETEARVFSPSIDLTGGMGYMSFYYYVMHGDSVNFNVTLNIYACDDELVYTLSDVTGNTWLRADVLLSCNHTFKIVFEGSVSGDGDIAIDDIAIMDAFGDAVDVTVHILDGNETIIFPTFFPQRTVIPTNESEINQKTKLVSVNALAIAMGLFAATVGIVLLSLLLHVYIWRRRRLLRRPIEVEGLGSLSQIQVIPVSRQRASGYMTIKFKTRRIYDDLSGVKDTIRHGHGHHGRPSKSVEIPEFIGFERDMTSRHVKSNSLPSLRGIKELFRSTSLTSLFHRHQQQKASAEYAKPKKISVVSSDSAGARSRDGSNRTSKKIKRTRPDSSRSDHLYSTIPDIIRQVQEELISQDGVRERVERASLFIDEPVEEVSDTELDPDTLEMVDNVIYEPYDHEEDIGIHNEAFERDETKEDDAL
ncbi:uncharacterized protein [Antedon mediterranea]|uniref:uncharacterized protein n=1 Tax=Antedon mediterranea TaxID=105859 RepID=UPI003AF8D744